MKPGMTLESNLDLYNQMILDGLIEDPLRPDSDIIELNPKGSSASGSGKDLESRVIEHGRYSVGVFIGRGNWGCVYEGIDIYTNEKVAIKVLNPTEDALRQMRERGLDYFEAMKKECAELKACSNIVPRKFEIDSNGKPFIVMPFYKNFLSDKLNEDYDRLKYKYGLSMKQIINYSRNLANGIREMHVKLKRVHGDIKPSNIAYEEGDSYNLENILLSDLGTSTCASLGLSMSPRDNMGDILTRAPESFLEGSSPTNKSDVWSFGSLLYRMFSGHYIFEQEIKSSKDPIKYMNSLDYEIGNKIIKKKLRKNVPFKWGKFLSKCLDIEPYKRFKDGNELKQNFEDFIENRNRLNSFKNHLYEKSFSITLSSIAIILLGYGIVTKQPTQVTMPKATTNIPYNNSMVIGKNGVFFERERIEKINISDTFSTSRSFESTINNITENRNVAYLLKTYNYAMQQLGSIKADIYTNHMFETYISNTLDVERQFPNYNGPLAVINKSIEVAMNQAKIDGPIDLEDMCTITRVGWLKWNKATKLSKSDSFNDYINAKDSKGKYVISKENRRFIKTWLNYIDLDSAGIPYKWI